MRALALLLLAACSREPCPSCPSCAVTTVVLTRDAGAPRPVPTADPERFVTDFSEVLGKWTSVNPLRFAEAEVVRAKPGSKTPFNLHVKTSALEVGCGFYETGVAFCRVQSEDKIEPRVETLVSFKTRDDGYITLAVSNVLAVEVWRVEP